MGIKKLKENNSMRVQTVAGLDIRLFNESIEVELTRMPFGVNLELVDARNSFDGTTPPGAYYRITFYKPATATGESGKVNEVKSVMPGAIYLSQEGVIITGCQSVPLRYKESIIDYGEGR